MLSYKGERGFKMWTMFDLEISYVLNKTISMINNVRDIHIVEDQFNIRGYS